MASSGWRRVLVLCGALALAATATAEPLWPAASRGDIVRWFQARADRVDFSREQLWGFSFSAQDGRSLEALSVDLVDRGYAISMLRGGPAAQLVVSKRELHSPQTIEERSRALGELARRHGARFAGCDLVF